MTTAQIVRTQVDKQAVSLPAPEALPLTVEQVLGQVALIQQVMALSMKDGEHFGKIPGCGDKPTLLKPGAEKLCLTFRLAPTYEVIERTQDGGHREFRVTATFTSILTQALIGQGVGFGTTMEAKYRFRAGAAEPTDKPVPRAYWDDRQSEPANAQELIGGKGFTVKKVDGQGWMIAKGGEKVEHDNPADHYNTVLKMAKKRALVDAVLTATAASDIFTQDLEDIRANLELATAAATASPAPAAALPSLPAPVPAGPAAPATPPAPPAVEAAEADDTADAPEETAPGEGEPFDFRLVEVPFGRCQGLALGLLTEEQIQWCETRWLPQQAGKVNPPADVRLFVRALDACREWRQTEQRQSGEARRAGERQMAAPAPAPKPRRARTKRATAAVAVQG